MIDYEDLNLFSKSNCSPSPKTWVEFTSTNDDVEKLEFPVPN